MPLKKALDREDWRRPLSEVDPCIFFISKNSGGHMDVDQSVTVPIQSSAHIETFARAHGLPCSSIFQVAWALVLRCYLGTESTCFAYLGHGEDQLDVGTAPEVEQNRFCLQICHAKIDGKLSASTILRKWGYISIRAFYEPQLGSDSEDVTGLAEQPLFNTAISFEERGPSDLSLFDGFKSVLFAHVNNSAHQQVLELSYKAPAIHKGQAMHIARTFDSVITRILSDSTKPIGELDLFNDWDQQQIACWNMRAPEPVNSCVHHEFRKAVSVSPNAEAVCSWDGSLTYSELDTLSSHLGHELTSLGVAPEVIVPLCFEKSLWAIVAMLAVVKAGGAYVCIDPSHPAARRRRIIQDVEATIVLVSASQSVVFGANELRTLVVGPNLVDTTQSSGNKDPPSLVQPHNAAYVVFTSGSTGSPKGIVIEHRALCTSLCEQGKAMAVQKGSRVLQYAAYTFDVSVGDIFTTLTHGGCLCIPSEEDRKNDLALTIGSMDVNQTCLTSSVASLLKPSDVPSLKRLTLGGEPATKQNLATWADRVTLNNIYGPAECTVWCVVQQNVRASDDEAKIGIGIGSTTWIADAENHHRLVPVGAVGELLLEGPVLAREYLKDPVKTDAAFIIDPDWVHRFGPANGRRLYKTGDLVRYGSNGGLLFIGRKDTQIKLRGQRVELGEIEHHLRRCVPETFHVAAELVVPTGGARNALLAAFICLETDFEGDQDLKNISDTTKRRFNAVTDRLEERLMSALPVYMIPSVYIPLKELPLTTSGKVDRKHLRQLASGLSIEQLTAFSRLSHTQRPPYTPMEKELAELWARILSLDLAQIGVDDSFLKFGGDSLAAMRLVATARASKICLTVALIFQYPRLSDMALVATVLETRDDDVVRPFELLGDEHASNQILCEAEEQCAVTRDLIEDIYPCTPLQEEMMLQSITTGLTQFAQEATELSPKLDLDTYRSAWNTVAQLNPVLRTRMIQTQKSGVMQVVLDERIDWQTPDNLKSYLEVDQHIPVRLGGQLCRFAVHVEPETGRRVFVFSMHHALFDGMSLGLIFESVYRTYKGLVIPIPSPFNAFIKHLMMTINTTAFESFWHSRLAGSKAQVFPALPSTAYRPCARSSSQHYIKFSRRTAPASNITTSTIIRGAWAMLLARCTRSADVVYGAFLAGRNASITGIDAIAAPTFANVPIRVLVVPDSTARNFLQELQDQAIAMIPFEHMGLQNISRVSSDAYAACQFQNLLVVQPLPMISHALGESPFPGNIISGPRLDANAMCNFNPYSLLVECTITGDGVAVRTSFDPTVVEPEEMRKILSSFEQYLHLLCGESEEPLRTVGQLDFVMHAGEL